MQSIRGITLFFCILLSIHAHAIEVFRTGSQQDGTSQWRSSLLLAGGGRDVDDAFIPFLRSAEGGDVVVLRASGSDGYNDYFYHELGVSLNSVTTLVFESREDAFQAEIKQLIENAECIFIAGGDQAKYFKYWHESGVSQAIQHHINQGKPIGGTSAGLAILGEKAYVALHEGSLDSVTALLNPFHPYITLHDSICSIPLLRGIITDTHFMQRNRIGRLIVFLLRTLSFEENTGWIGLGVDEATALWVDADGQGQVYGDRNGKVHLISVLQAPQCLHSDQPVDGGLFQLTSLGSGSSIHMETLEVSHPESNSIFTIKDGKLEHADLPSPDPT